MNAAAEKAVTLRRVLVAFLPALANAKIATTVAGAAAARSELRAKRAVTFGHSRRRARTIPSANGGIASARNSIA